jgi:hypothetical protein
MIHAWHGWNKKLDRIWVKDPWLKDITCDTETVRKMFIKIHTGNKAYDSVFVVTVMHSGSPFLNLRFGKVFKLSAADHYIRILNTNGN